LSQKVCGVVLDKLFSLMMCWWWWLWWCDDVMMWWCDDLMMCWCDDVLMWWCDDVLDFTKCSGIRSVSCVVWTLCDIKHKRVCVSSALFVVSCAICWLSCSTLILWLLQVLKKQLEAFDSFSTPLISARW
jgi:hypothetical protein